MSYLNLLQEVGVLKPAQLINALLIFYYRKWVWSNQLSSSPLTRYWYFITGSGCGQVDESGVDELGVDESNGDRMVGCECHSFGWAVLCSHNMITDTDKADEYPELCEILSHFL